MFKMSEIEVEFQATQATLEKPNQKPGNTSK